VTVSYGITFTCKFDFAQSENIKLRLNKITPVSYHFFPLASKYFSYCKMYDLERREDVKTLRAEGFPRPNVPFICAYNDLLLFLPAN
jgi:hypothetical protein